MALKEYEFQADAVNRLTDAYYANKRNVILEAPTGSGKTVILIKLMDRLLKEVGDSKDIAFVWLTPGAGDLERQSWSKTMQFATVVKPQLLDDALDDGFRPGTVTFLNWEKVNNADKIALRNGDRGNLPTSIRNAKNKNVEFILIIDEEHKNQTKAAQNIINLFDADIIYRASATPIEDLTAKLVRIDEDSVIAAGLITREVVLNDNLTDADTDTYGDDEDFLDAANEKRLEIKAAYSKLNKNINPLVLVQFPDETKYDDEINTKVQRVKDYLINELGVPDDDIAYWLSDKKKNTEGIANPDSPVSYLFMKQAVSSGWDAPRAKILVKLRLNTTARFTIQTIGRIRRMPEQKHYNNPLLDDAYVYSNDEKYVADIIKQNAGGMLTQMGLKPEVSPNIFHLDSLKKGDTFCKDLSAVTQALRKEFEREFNIGPNEQPKKNKEILAEYGWYFGTDILTELPTGKVEKLSDIAELARKPARIPITNTRNFGYRYDAVMALIRPYLHIGSDLKDVRAIINDLFANSEPGSNVKRILTLKPRERYGFVINNARELRDVVKRMDANYYQMTISESLRLDTIKLVPFELNEREGYLDTGRRAPLLTKNVYAGYTKANWLKQSHGEKMFEEQAEKISKIKWVYRSKDHGREYFSIVYDAGTREFYPDYLVKTVDDETYIIEIKGANNDDDYAEAKFDALKEYTQREGANVKFAFVRQSKKFPKMLVYSDTKWVEDPDDTGIWKPIAELFK